MKYQLVIQFPEKLKGGFDRLIAIEEELEEKLIDAEVDGHDIGSGQMNIFILTEHPLDTFKYIKSILKQENDIFSEMKVAYRDIEDENFNCLWPEDLTKFQVI